MCPNAALQDLVSSVPECGLQILAPERHGEAETREQQRVDGGQRYGGHEGKHDGSSVNDRNGRYVLPGPPSILKFLDWTSHFVAPA
jgi:hypothetical protein